jgi:glycosyltransferase involved in cell wall biosynthesis
MKMCQAFAKNGHDVVLLAPDAQGTEPGIDDIFDFYGVKKCFKVEKLPWINSKSRVIIYGFFAALRAKKLRPDLVYCRNLLGGFFSILAGLPVIYEVHDTFKHSNRFYKGIFDRFLHSKGIKKLVVISKALGDHYRKQHNIPEHQIIVAPDGADELTEHGDKFPLDIEKLQIGYIGHLFPGRGVEVIYDLSRNCQWGEFHLIGGVQSDVDFWQEKAKDLPNLVIHGFVPHSETARYYRSFDVLIAPYQRQVSVWGGQGDTAQWMSPLKLFEYMAAGKAILCSDLPVLREILTDEENALMCEPENNKSWRQALLRLKESPTLREKLGNEAKKQLLSNYTWQVRAQRILESIPN